MADSGLTPRLIARIRKDFPDDYEDVARDLGAAESGNQDRERVLAAIVISAQGNLYWLRAAVELSRVDWRDVLMNGGLGHVGWPARLDRELGPVS